jgi:RNA recognition motif 2
MDVHPLMHLRIHRPYVYDSRSSYPRQMYQYPPVPTYFNPLDLRVPSDRWPTTAKSPPARTNFDARPEVPRPEIPRSQPPPSSLPADRKWTPSDLENYFNQMRITPLKTRDVLAKAAENIGTLRSMHPAARATTREFAAEGLLGPTRRERSGDEASTPLTPVSPVSPSAETDESLSSSGGESCSLGSNGGVPERNRIVLEKVMMGLDKRTTIMIKNVPNKYTQVSLPVHPWCLSLWDADVLKQMLKEYVDITNAGTYDFLYLRIDFQNRCKYIPPRFTEIMLASATPLSISLILNPSSPSPKPASVPSGSEPPN